MDFFAHQDRARASTRRLIVVYTLCLLGVVLSLNFIAFLIWGVANGTRTYSHSSQGSASMQTMTISLPERIADGLPVFATTTISVLSIVGLATMFKKLQIGGDGAKVAELLGGRPIVAAPSDPQERKLMNVVEEMSLASGVPMPRVYLMENEQGINAFAAGTRPEAAVIGVTRGCIEKLNRDELQGVIAHEFSHILNGDMRLNLRLIALNFGLLAIGYIGLQILRFSPRSSSSRNNKNGGGAGAILAFALAMMVIGYIGMFFGKLLQAAVSRQREFLADASAVQFTRNPSGISNALKKIGGFSHGAELKSVHAGEMSHMFFADGVVGLLDSLFATHPPLDKRIKAIDPSFDGKMTRTSPVAANPFPAASGFAAPPPLPEAGQRVVAPPAQIVEEVGNIQPEKLSFAGSTIAAIPNAIEAAAADPYSARAVAVALLLDRDPEVRQRQLQAVHAEDEHVAALAAQLQPHIAQLGPAARLPILDLALPSLHHLSRSQLTAFRNLCDVLSRADRRISAFEIALAKIVDHQLLSRAEYDIAIYRSVSAVKEPLRIVLSVLALTGGNHQAQRAYDLALARIGLPAGPMAGPEEAKGFDRALSELRQSSPPVQRRVVDACAHGVAADGTVGIEEMELMRAICAALSVPVPPFLQLA